MGLLDMISDRVAKIIGDEAGRQNAIARFGTGIPIDKDGNVADPRDETKKMHVDAFNKLPVNDRMTSIAPAVNRLMEVPQIRPEDIDIKMAAALLKSSVTSGDDIASRMKSMINGNSTKPEDSAPKLKM